MNIDWKKIEDVRQALTALENKEITIQDIIKETKNSSTFWLFFCDADFFKELKKKNLLTDEDIKYLLKELFKSIETITNLKNFNEIYNNFYDLNTDSVRTAACDQLKIVEEIIKNNLIGFREVIDKFKTIEENDNNSDLWYVFKTESLFKDFLKAEELLKELIESNKLNIEELRYLFDEIDCRYEVDNFDEQSYLLRYSVNNDVVTFKELVDKFKSTYRLESLLKSEEAFKELIENNKIPREDFRYLLNKINDSGDLLDFRENSFLFRHIVDNGIISFKDLIDKYKTTKNVYSHSCLDYLLCQFDDFSHWLENNKLTKDDLRYLFDEIETMNELQKIHSNSVLLQHIIDKDIVSFKELINKYKNIKEADADSFLYYLLSSDKYFKYWLETNKLTNDDLRYLLNKINYCCELNRMCGNDSLLKHILNEFLLNKDLVKKFNELLETDEWHKDLHTLFEYIGYYNKKNKELLKLNELNRVVYNFDRNQCLELIEILKNNKVAQNTLIQIIDSNLQDQYDFEQLKRVLIKDNDKKLKTKFNF